MCGTWLAVWARKRAEAKGDESRGPPRVVKTREGEPWATHDVVSAD